MTAPLNVADEVWVTTADEDRTTPSTHPGDLRRATGLPAWRRREFLTGRALLRALLAEVSPASADAEIIPDPRGKPFLHGHAETGVSVSHSRGALAAGVALGRPLGVDLQRPGTTVTPSFTRRLLGRHAPRITALPSARAAEEVAWVWTAQEACVKADGTGFAGRPWTIDIPPGTHRGRWGTYHWISLRDRSPLPLSCAFPPRPA